MSKKISKMLLEDIRESIEAGATIRTVCAYAGISKSTYYRWMARGESQESGPYRDFWDTALRALAKVRGQLEILATQRALGGIETYETQTNICKCCGSSEAVTVTTQTLPPDSRLLMWILERRYPEDWGRTGRPPVYDFVSKPAEPISLFGKVNGE